VPLEHVRQMSSVLSEREIRVYAVLFLWQQINRWGMFVFHSTLGFYEKEARRRLPSNRLRTMWFAKGINPICNSTRELSRAIRPRSRWGLIFRRADFVGDGVPRSAVILTPIGAVTRRWRLLSVRAVETGCTLIGNSLVSTILCD
jgi:hypothetical protein